MNGWPQVAPSLPDPQDIQAAAGSFDSLTSGAGGLSVSGGLFSSPDTVVGDGALGAISLAKYVSEFRTTGAATATMAAGQSGQCKRIALTADAGDLVVTVTNLFGGTTITLNDAGDSIDLQYLHDKWYPTGGVGCLIG